MNKTFLSINKGKIENFATMIRNPVQEWTLDEVKRFLKSCNIISTGGSNGMNTIIDCLDECKKQACSNANAPFKSFWGILTLDEINDLYDIKQFAESTITPEQFDIIIEQIVELRARGVLELAYFGYFQNADISELKPKDIEVSDNGKVLGVTTINNKGARKVRQIENSKAIADLITLKKSTNDNEYVIKHIKSFQTSTNPLADLSQLVKYAMANVECDGVKCREMGVEDFRRSRKLWYYHLINIGKMTMSEVDLLIDSHNSDGDKFYFDMARRMYEEK